MSREELRIPLFLVKKFLCSASPLRPYHVTAGSLINPKYPLSVGATPLHLCLWERHASALICFPQYYLVVFILVSTCFILFSWLLCLGIRFSTNVSLETCSLHILGASSDSDLLGLTVLSLFRFFYCLTLVLETEKLQEFIVNMLWKSEASVFCETRAYFPYQN